MSKLDLILPPAPKPLGAYVTAVQSGRLLFLSGMLPLVEGKPQYLGRVGAELTLEQGRDAAYTACLNALAVMRAHLGSLDKVTRVVRLGVAIVTAPGFYEHARLADAASELLREVFGEEKTSTRIILGSASLPLNLPLELELIVEVEA